MNKTYIYIFLLQFMFIPFNQAFAASRSQPIIADHNAVKEFDNIPVAWLNQAKNLTLHFAHTSHGSQIISGLEKLNQSTYGVDVKTGGSPGLPGGNNILKIYDGNNYNTNTYITPDLYWSTADAVLHTRSVVDTGLFNLSMWSWCGQQSDNDTTTTQTYLDRINSLNSIYSNTTFIYMTGHLDGGGPNGNLHKRNEQVRNYVINHNGVLFDFGDIERFDPEGRDYLNLGAGANDSLDGCVYNSGNWCTSWCSSYSSSPLCQEVDCAHSESLNCNLKARAFWWMMARVAGWDGGTGSPTATDTPAATSTPTPSVTPGPGIPCLGANNTIDADDVIVWAKSYTSINNILKFAALITHWGESCKTSP